MLAGVTNAEMRWLFMQPASCGGVAENTWRDCAACGVAV